MNVLHRRTSQNKHTHTQDHVQLLYCAIFAVPAGVGRVCKRLVESKMRESKNGMS
jgi:hypothetical protein